LKTCEEMFRKYKKVPGTRHYQDYSPESLAECIKLIKNKKITIKAASESFKIPKRTLFRKLKDSNVCAGVHSKIGRKTIFTEEEEESFVQHLLLMAEFDFPITKDDLRICVKNYLTEHGRDVAVFKENIPGVDWVNNFLNRHPIVRARTAENVKLLRAGITKQTLEEYIKNLEKTVRYVPSENIYNFDETNLTDNPGKKKVDTYRYPFFIFLFAFNTFLCICSLQVLVKRGTKYPELIQNSSKVSTSLMTCGTAAGEILPLYVVYKSGKVWTTWMEGGPENCKYDCSLSGWLDACTFENWFMRILLPNAKRKPGPKVVICDNLSSHLNENVIEKCKKHNIKFVFLPSNTTHLTQPLMWLFSPQ